MNNIPMNNISYNKLNVNTKANEFSLVGKDVALQECNDARLTSPPGESSLAFFMLDGRNAPLGGSAQNSIIASTKTLVLNYHKCPGELFDPDFVGMSCSLDSHDLVTDSGTILTRLDTCKQVGICNVNELVGWVDRFEDRKAQREKLSNVLLKSGRYREAINVASCGENFIAYEARCCHDTIARPLSCGHRLCPVCMSRRSNELATKVEKFILRMSNPKHLVLTVENVPKIDKAYFGWLRRCFTKLRHRDIFDRCVGGFYSIETTYNSEHESWHVHLHIVADVPYIVKQDLVDAWNSITENSFIVSIRAIGREGQSALEAAREIAKYVVKPGEFLQDVKLVDEFLKAVKGMRLVSTFGKYYRMVLDDDDDDPGLPECRCGENDWHRLDTFYTVADVYKDTRGFYRLKNFISDG